jgi:hypothetical protein
MKVSLDTTKLRSPVYGDRVPGDPHYQVHWWQDGLPFDIKGDLVPDDNRTGPWKGLNSENKEVTYYPLWTDQMRVKLNKKLERMSKVGRPVDDEIDEIHDDTSEEAKREAAEAVNLVAWLKGEIDYDPAQVFNAARHRYGRAFNKISTLVNELVIDEKAIKEDEIRPSFKPFLEMKQTNAA